MPATEAGTVEVSDEQTLQKLCGATRVDGTLVLSTDLEQLACLSDLRIVAGDLEIVNNERLRALAGFGRLEHIEGDLTIMQNEQLRSLQGLQGLRSVGGSVLIAGNPSLQSLDGLSSLRRVAGGLLVEANEELGSIGGLASLSFVGDRVGIADGQVPPGDIAALLDRLAAPYADDLALLEKHARAAPYDRQAGVPLPAPADVVRVVERFRREGRSNHLPFLLEYGLRVHLANLQVTRLARELPMDDPVLAEFVRLAPLPQYRSAHQAGWLNRQFHGQFDRSGYSSYQVYVWAKEHSGTWMDYPNWRHVGDLLQEIDRSGLGGLGGGDPCHYGCDWRDAQ